MFVAPVTVGDGAYTGAGAVVREDVPPGALAVSAAPQRNIEDWVQRKRPGTPAAAAAAAARDQTGDQTGTAPDQGAGDSAEPTGEADGGGERPGQADGPGGGPPTGRVGISADRPPSDDGDTR
jgi:ribosomal protein L12E/L44/L45/RPP1/RPP2